jgi:hypothetical protein
VGEVGGTPHPLPPLLRGGGEGELKCGAWYPGRCPWALPWAGMMNPVWGSRRGGVLGALGFADRTGPGWHRPRKGARNVWFSVNID